MMSLTRVRPPTQEEYCLTGALETTLSTFGTAVDIRLNDRDRKLVLKALARREDKRKKWAQIGTLE